MPQVSRPSRAPGALAFAGVCTFALVCTMVQFLRTDLNWIAAPLSYYLTGPYGDMVIAAYVVLGAALAILGAGLYRSAARGARSAAPMLLFETAAIALMVTALSEPAKAYGNPVIWEMIHLAAAETTFLCVTVAMILQSLWMRRDAYWRAGAGARLALALVAFGALWTYALWRQLPRGLSQKTVIALIVIWLGWAALGFWRRPVR